MLFLFVYSYFQLRVANEQVIEERRLNDSTLDGLSHEMAMSRQSLRDITRRERQVIHPKHFTIYEYI